MIRTSGGTVAAADGCERAGLGCTGRFRNGSVFIGMQLLFWFWHGVDGHMISYGQRVTKIGLIDDKSLNRKFHLFMCPALVLVLVLVICQVMVLFHTDYQ
jgi:hypothetical protein